MSEVKVTPKKCAKIWMEDAEVCREYYKTDKITFGMSELPVGGVGGIDPGHAEADEVFYCVQGEVLCYVSQDDMYYRMEEGDAMLQGSPPVQHRRQEGDPDMVLRTPSVKER